MTAKQRRGPGRPPLSEGEETRVLYLRLPASEHEALSAVAAQLGEKVAEYARRELRRAAKRDARKLGSEAAGRVGR